jgi:hypothetical protein
MYISEGSKPIGKSTEGQRKQIEWEILKRACNG